MVKVEETYRIVVSDTPARLAADVTGLLLQGWDLYGYPFVDGLNGKLFCQAMLRDPMQLREPVPTVKAEIRKPEPQPQKVVAVKPVKVPRPRPVRPRIPTTFRNVAAFLGVMFGAYFLVESLIFRTGIYARYLEPESASGDFERTVYAELHRKPTGKKEVLVIGSSRLAEDFSPKIVNQRKPDDGYWFVNGSILHGGVRDWYYFVREVDPKRNRYKSIMIPLEDYDDFDSYTDIPDRVVDLRLTISRLRLMDIWPFTASFRTWRGRFEVFRGALLKGVVYQRDLQEFAEDPATRIAKVTLFRNDAQNWYYDYGGIEHKLTGLAVDWTTRRVTSLPADNQGGDWPKYYHQNLIDDSPQNGIMRGDQVRWVGALVDLYKDSQTKIIVYQVPRGPTMPPYPRAHLPWTTVQVLAKRPWVTVVDRHKFEPLEKPELFGDLLHMNSDGRAIFSPMLADVAKEILH